jgi:hypothetical protein
MKRIILIAILFLFIPISFAKASVVFSEVMYDPQGTDSKHEWVEVYNNGSDSVDLTKYYLQTDGVSSTYHSITAIGQALLPANTYAVITQDTTTFQSDNVGFGGMLYDSSWSDLSDTVSKNLVINDANKVALDQYSYTVSLANNDGNSLQKNSSGLWVVLIPTPGTGSLSTQDTSTTTTIQDTNSTSTTKVNSAITSTAPVPSSSNPEALLIMQKSATVGIPIRIVPQLIGVNNIPFNQKSFHISFGDGSDHYDYSTLPINHTYSYPGTYVVYFEYIQKPNSPYDGEILSAKKLIEVLPQGATISNVYPDGSVEISNPTSREIDISEWKIRSIISPDIFYIIPKNTFVLSGKKIILPNYITNFSSDNVREIMLSLPSGTIVSLYGTDDASENKIVEIQQTFETKKPVSLKNTSKVSKISTTLTEEDLKNTSDNNNLNKNNFLGAQAENSLSNTQLPIIPILIGFAGILVVSIFIIKSLNSELKEEVLENKDMSTQSIADRIKIIDE